MKPGLLLMTSSRCREIPRLELFLVNYFGFWWFKKWLVLVKNHKIESPCLSKGSKRFHAEKNLSFPPKPITQATSNQIASKFTHSRNLASDSRAPPVWTIILTIAIAIFTRKSFRSIRQFFLQIALRKWNTKPWILGPKHCLKISTVSKAGGSVNFWWHICCVH